MLRLFYADDSGDQEATTSIMKKKERFSTTGYNLSAMFRHIKVRYYQLPSL